MSDPFITAMMILSGLGWIICMCVALFGGA